MNFNLSDYKEQINIIKAFIENKEYNLAYNLSKKLLEKYVFNDDKYVFDILQYQSTCEDIDDKRFTQYNSDLVQKFKNSIFNKTKGITNNSITITTTTCKRLDLFTQTVNSFLECCLDIDKYIYEWIVIDDNSSESDREYMKTHYPFIRYILKNPDQKGHSRSMNILLDEIQTPYVLNLEDDWRFFVKDNYLTKCIEVLSTNQRYGQCLLNRSYGEDIGSVARIGGGFRRYTPSGTRYYIHEYLIGDALVKCTSRLNGKTNCIYWPHYSLRVGVTRSEVYKKIGKYNEKAQHFEQEYAYRYYIQGRYLTTYLDSVYCTHIGRRTYERDTNKLNAYDLNDENQFGQAPKQVRENKTSENVSMTIDVNNSSESLKKSETPPIDPKNLPQIRTKIYVLNLKRRPDRLTKFNQMNYNELPQYHIFNAIDGMELKPNHKVQKLFQHNDYKYRRGIVGCALSHVAMWGELIKSNDLQSMIILEDDAELTTNFIQKVLHSIHTSKDADIIFFGHHPYTDYKLQEDFQRNGVPTTEQWSRERCIRESMGGTTGYYITKRGAINMFKYINVHSIVNGIDWVMFKTADINKIFYCSPFLVFADCFQDNIGKVDTDIQSIYDGCGYKNNDDWLKDEINYLIREYNLKGLNIQIPKFIECMRDENSIVKVTEKYPENKREFLSNIIICKEDYNKLKTQLQLFPVRLYNVNEYVFSFPDSLCNEKLLNEKTFNGYINHFNPVDL
jgi:GR25 family glycosyltransferase involved in LPS biosynthesis